MGGFMFRKFLLATLMAVSALSVTAHAAAPGIEEHVMPASDDRWVPWPFHLAQPFPWQDIQGMWKVEQGDFTSYFSLKVVREKSTGVRQLQVKQYDGDNCRIIATGVALERNQKVLAQMTVKGGDTYRFQLTAFSEKDSPIPPLKGTIATSGVMVLSMGPLNDQVPADMIHLQIMKISDHLTQKFCIEDVKR